MRLTLWAVVIPVTVLLLGVVAGGFAVNTLWNTQGELESLQRSVNTCRENLTEAQEEVRTVTATLKKERERPEPEMPTCPNTTEREQLSFDLPFDPVESSLTRHQEVSRVAANRDEVAQLLDDAVTEDNLRYAVSSLYMNALEFRSAFVEDGTTVRMGGEAHDLLQRHKQYTEELEQLHDNFAEYPRREKRQQVRKILQEFDSMYGLMLLKV